MTLHDEAPPFLITLGFDPATFERLDDLRARYFPPDRNIVPAHLSLFHKLPGSDFDAIDAELARVAAERAPVRLRFQGPKPTGRGVLIPVDALGLGAIRAELARTFDRHLTPQDRQGFRPHVMVMNKADRQEADAALDEIRAGYAPWSGTGDRLILWRYLGGPWEEVANYPLTGAPEAPRR